MKILAIRGTNLASLEGDFNIDFSVEPLKSAGIFSISGSTGSGKSTILDALCLALYDNTPRTNSASESIFIKDVNDTKINQKDSRSILRRGSAHGYAAAQFISLSGDKYLSEWSVRRARDRANGSLQGVAMRLTNLTTGIEEQGRKTDILAKIVQITGLTFEQFTRAVLLAQGDFATFLKANKADKAELLEKLTGTDIYSRISVIIYEKNKEAQQELNSLKEKIKETELLTPEQLESFQEEKIKTEIDIEKLEKEIKKITDKLKWISDNNLLINKLELSQKELLVIEENIKKATPQFELIAKYDQLQEIRDPFYELENLKKELKSKQDTKVTLEKELIEFEKLLEESVKNLAKAKQQKLDLSNEYNVVLPQIKKAAELDHSLNLLKSRETEAYSELKIVLTKKEASLKEINTRELDIKKIETEVKNHLSVLEKHKRFESIILRKESLNNYLTDYVNAVKMAGEFSKLKNDSLKSFESQKSLLKSLKEREETLNQMLPTEIAVLRNRLQDGVPCPVCGSTHHPLKESSSQQTLQEEQLNREKKELALQIERVEKSIKLAEQEIIKAETQASTYTQSQQKLAESIDEILTEIPDWKATLDKGVLQSGLVKLYNLWEKHTQEHAKGVETIKELEVKLGSEKQNCKAIEETVTEKQDKANLLSKETQALTNERKNLLNGESVKAVEDFYTKKFKEIEESIERADKQNNTILLKKSSNISVLEQISKETIKQITRKDFLDASIAQWISNHNSINSTIISSNKLENENLDRNHLDNNDFNNNEVNILTYQQASAIILTPINILKAAKTETIALTDSQKRLKATIEERQKNLDNHQKEPTKPNIENPEAFGSQINIESQENIERSDNLENQENLDKLTYHKSIETEEHLENLQKEKQLTLKQSRDNFTRVQIALTNHQKAEKKIEIYTKAFKEKEEVGLNWSKLNELYGSATGSKFKEIAQGYTLEALLTYANIHLKELTGRYELQRIDDSLGLQVADLDMLGEVRAVHSLSGGESFLISLALALGLSSLSSSKMKIESLFIDEGFGSLDIDTLRTAMDALERLQTTGRKIGVISHVAEMTERVGVQIKVNKIVNGRSQIEIQS